MMEGVSVVFELFSFLDPACFQVDSFEQDARHLTICIETTAAQACCPVCQTPSDRVHSRYRRCPADLPCLGKAVRLHIDARRFFCSHALCPRKIFTERLPSLLAPWARRTQRLDQMLTQLVFELGGEASQRVCHGLKMPVSASTALRQIRKTPVPAPGLVSLLGVDDFAFRRGTRYGTLLVDLQSRRPIELLPDREADTLVAWLREHPEVKLISRDRAGGYADGARRGAPEALQVADRFHLLQNLGQMLEKVLRRLAPAIKAHLRAPLGTEEPSQLQEEQSSQKEAQNREPTAEKSLRQHRFDEVHRLFAQGYRLGPISQQVGISRHTVQRYLSLQKVPDWKDQRRRPSLLDPAHSYLQARFRQGCHNGAQLARELHERGQAGSAKLVERYLKRWKQEEGLAGKEKEPAAANLFSSRRISRLAGARPASLTVQEREEIEAVCQAEEQAKEAIELVQRFAHAVRERQEENLTDWLQAAKESQVKEVRGFAQGIERDEAAVRAALSEDWSNGQVEAQVNRLKVLKRQMYGRARFDLLRQRVVYRHEREPDDLTQEQAC